MSGVHIQIAVAVGCDLPPVCAAAWPIHWECWYLLSCSLHPTDKDRLL